MKMAKKRKMKLVNHTDKHEDEVIVSPDPSSEYIDIGAKDSYSNDCNHIYVRDVQSCLSLCSKLQSWKKPYCVIYYLYSCPYCNDANHEINTCFQELPDVCWIKCEVSLEKDTCKKMVHTETFPAIRVFDGSSTKSLFEHNRAREDYLEFFGIKAEEDETASKSLIRENSDSVKCADYDEDNIQYPCMIFIYANWCGHCRTTKPHWNEAVEKMGDVTPYAISDESPELLKAFEVQGFPTIIGFDKDKKKHDFPPQNRTAETLVAFSKTLT